MHRTIQIVALTGSLLAALWAGYADRPQIDWQPTFLDSMAPYTIVLVNPPDEP